MRVNPTLAMTRAIHGGNTLVAVGGRHQSGRDRSVLPTCPSSQRQADQQAQGDGEGEQGDGPREDFEDHVGDGGPEVGVDQVRVEPALP